MYNHAPHNYVCPFCSLLQGNKNKDLLSVASDIFYRDEDVCAMISSHQWPKNHGHALVFPIEHYENIYDLPVELGGKIHMITQKIALGMKSLYDCDGISTRQHNEPAGNQDVWHYHLHVFPRYAGDQLYASQYAEMPAKDRAEFANLLRYYFRNHSATHGKLS
jgi:histidine triad (HIT) family protein